MLKIKDKNRINLRYQEEGIKEALSEKMVTLSILVPESLRDKLKVKAIHNKTNVTNILIKHIKEYLDK